MYSLLEICLKPAVTMPKSIWLFKFFAWQCFSDYLLYIGTLLLLMIIMLIFFFFPQMLYEDPIVNVDTEKQTLKTNSGKLLKYGSLIIATGCSASRSLNDFFGSTWLSFLPKIVSVICLLPNFMCSLFAIMEYCEMLCLEYLAERHGLESSSWFYVAYYDIKKYLFPCLLLAKFINHL